MKNLLVRLPVFTIVISLCFFLHCNTGAELSNGGGMDSEFTVTDITSGTLTFFISSGKVLGTTNIAYGKAGTKEDIHSLVVTITELEVHRVGDSNAGWKILPLSGDRYDLIELDKSMWADLLSSTNPEKGEYNKIRFTLSSATVITDSGTYEAEIPGDKIKIKVPFSVHEDGTTEITVIIDPKASVKSNGNKNGLKYFFNPVLKISSKIED